MPLLRSQFGATPETRLVFIDDHMTANAVNGCEVWTFDQFRASSADIHLACIAVADGKIRELLADKCLNAAIGIVEARAASVIEMDDVQIGPGACLSPFFTMTSNIRIGSFFHGNLYSYIEHDCVVGDFVTFAPGAQCNGNVHIGSHAYIGAGAIIRQGTSDNPLMIGDGATVGMGAVVVKNVPAGATVIGNPARILEK